MTNQLSDLGDEALLRRAREGCEESFHALYHRHQGRIYRFALDLSGSETIAEEVAQEVFLALVAELDRYDPTRGSLLPYLLGVARNHTYRLLRTHSATVPLDGGGEDELALEDTAAGNVLMDLQQREALDTLRDLIATLPHPYREAVVLCDLEELDYAQAARVVGCPIGTVRSRLHRARTMLYEKWNAEIVRRDSLRRPA
jgi:RNA polymerase sigma-70 factor (ECF subfamily)